MTDPHDDRVAHALRDAASGLDRGTAGFGKALAGRYTSADAAGDVSWAVATGAHWASALAACWAQLLRPAPDAAETRDVPAVGVVGERVHAKLHPGVTARPISLAAAGFRAIGWGQEFVLAHDAFRFNPDPPDLPAGTDSFGVTVLSDGVPPGAKRHTLIFEGMVVDRKTGAVVAGPIRVVKPASSA
jgi:hypothetical protein